MLSKQEKELIEESYKNKGFNVEFTNEEMLIKKGKNIKLKFSLPEAKKILNMFSKK